jgi:hypothetical protein
MKSSNGFAVPLDFSSVGAELGVLVGSIEDEPLGFFAVGRVRVVTQVLGQGGVRC